MSLVCISRKLGVKLIHDFSQCGNILPEYVAVIGERRASHFLMELDLGGVIGVIETTPQTGLVFSYHHIDALPGHPPCGWVGDV